MLRMPPLVAEVRQIMEDIGGFVDVEDNRPLPGIEISNTSRGA